MYTVLMVDDEEDIRKALISAVDWNELGFEIVGEASNGVEALELVEQLDPDLLVSDIKMPLVGGIELARAVRELRPNVQIVFLSGYDHFKFAKEAIRYNILEYLLKPLSPKQIVEEFKNIKIKMDEKYGEILDIDSHIDAIKELQTVKKDLLFTNLLLNNITNHQIELSFDDIEVSIPVSLPNGHAYLVCVVSVKSQGRGSEHETDLKRLLNIANIVSKKYLNCECLIHKNYVVICACESENALKKYVRILTKDIVLSAKRVMNVQVHIGQSQNFADIMNLGKAFSEGREALSSIENTDEQIIAYSDILSPQEDFSIADMIFELELKIKLSDEAVVREYAEQIFRYMSSSKISPVQYNICILELQMMLYRAQGQLQGEFGFGTEVFSAFAFSKSRKEIEEDIKSFATRLAGQISSQRKKTLDVLSESAVEMIKKEYANSEMSLNLLSERLHCSPNYLSGLIKRNVGKSFIDILTECRMLKARELLMSTAKKIMEISEEVGYSDQHYFSYSFKKYFNQSPNQMRKNETR